MGVGLATEGPLVINHTLCFNIIASNPSSESPNSVSCPQPIYTALSPPQQPGKLPSLSKCINALRFCRKSQSLPLAKCLHLHLCEHGLDCYDYLGNYLVPVFVDCDDIPLAHMVFNKLDLRAEHSWTSLIYAYINSQDVCRALNILQYMEVDRVQPSTHTFVALLTACAKEKLVETGQVLHDSLIANGLDLDQFVGNSLVDMYAKCGFLVEAKKIFDSLIVRNVIAWNALIGGYSEHGHNEDALESFNLMKLEGLSPSDVTLVCVLRACAHLGYVHQGSEAHAEIAVDGLERNCYIGNALIDMYAKCGCLGEAFEVLEDLAARDVVSWTALLAGFAEQGQRREALDCFERMQEEGVLLELVAWNAIISCYADEEGKASLKLYHRMLEQGNLPDNVTFKNILKACSSASALEVGRNIHAQMSKALKEDIILTNALIDTYGNCGSLNEAHLIFDSMQRRGSETWNALITAYAQQGDHESIFSSFGKMEEEGMQPDDITFVSVLNSYSHAGLPAEGQWYFMVMTNKYGITPNAKHYGCMVDLFGRLGLLNEAVCVVKEMCLQPDFVTWMALLNATW